MYVEKKKRILQEDNSARLGFVSAELAGYIRVSRWSVVFQHFLNKKKKKKKSSGKKAKRNLDVLLLLLLHGRIMRDVSTIRTQCEKYIFVLITTHFTHPDMFSCIRLYHHLNETRD